MEKLKAESLHWKDFKINAEDFGYGTIVITSHIQGRKDLAFGRIVQVRKKSGAFGYDTILLRQADGLLYSYHNMGFFSVDPEFIEQYEEAMKYSDELKKDKIGDTYDIMGVNPASGFIVHGLDDTHGKIYSFAITVTKSNSPTPENL